MKQILRILFLLMVGISSNCIIYQPEIYKHHYYNLEAVNRGLVDTTTIDTIQWIERYNNFIKTVNPINRSSQDIENIIKKNENKILDVFEYYAKKLNISEIDTVWSCLEPKGSLMISTINGKHLTDTNELNTIKNMLSNVSFEPSREGDYFCRFNTKIDKNAIKLIPDILIGEVRGRSKIEIMKVVMKYLPNMRYAYNRRLREVAGIKGKITIKFHINHYGKVTYTNLEETTVGDQLLKEAIIQQIQNWKFEFIYNKDDVTEVIYPFIFSQ